MAQSACLAGLACACALVVSGDVAHACGGCFVGDQDNTVVTGHRMALSVSLDQTVLWDQIEYDGDPAEFSWVLPVKPGARLEVANDAWFDVLDAGTAMVVGQPQINCNQGGDSWGGESGSGGYLDEGWDGDYDDGGSFGCGCGSKHNDAAELASGAGSESTTGPSSTGFSASTGGNEAPLPPPPDVNVVHQGTVGPYETVTLSTDIPGVLDDWLAEHGYNVPPDIQPVIDAYVAEGFDFIALRLVPGERVRAMKPVRVISPGVGMALPLRMVAAGTGAKTALTLFVIGEGRYQMQNFPNTTVATESLTWDFATSSSNYSLLRQDALAMEDGHVWLTTYAKSGTLFGPELDNIAPMWNVTYSGTSYSVETLAEAYVHQGVDNGETSDMSCLAAIDEAETYGGAFVDTCDELGNCADPPVGQMAAHELACGTLDDLAVALTGMHPQDVWITRFEAELPRAALESDLLLEAADPQLKVENRLVAPNHDGDPCASAGTAFVPRGPRRPPLPPGGFATLFLAATAFVAARRRWQRVRYA